MNNPFRLLAPSMVALLTACADAPITCPENKPAPPENEPAPPAVSETTATWKAPPNRAFGIFASASAKDEGAIAYAEVEAPADSGSSTRIHIKLQRLDGVGALYGSSIELGVVESDFLSGLTLAGDGDHYVACWAHDSQIACAAAPVGEGSVSPGLSMAGDAPSLAYSSGTWALAYAIPGNLAIVRLASDGTAAESPVTFEAGEDPYFSPIVLLAATKLGFVLVGGDNVRVHALDFDFSPVAESVDLGLSPWTYGGIAATEAKVAISLSVPYANKLFLFEDGTLMATQEFGGGGKLGLPVALAADGSSFGVLIPHENVNQLGEDKLFYRSIPDACAPSSERAQDVDFTVNIDAPRTLLRLKDDMFHVAVPTNQEVIVTRIHRP